MSKMILTESSKSKFKVLEHKPTNVLKRIQGVLSDFKSNRNGRIYPRELWENVLSSDYVKEMIESHGLVGELDHPEERLEISLQNVSHVINDMWIEGDQVLGIIDILPTPSGKIVSDLLDYGTDIGISSRGAGSVGSGNIVDPDYQFVTFDFVARPSCEAARLNTILESVQHEIDNNSDDKVNAILEGYKNTMKEKKLSTNLDIDNMVKELETNFKGVTNKNYIKKSLDKHLELKMITKDEYDMLKKKYLNESIETYDLNDTDYEGMEMVLNYLHGKVDLEHDSLSTIEDLVHEAVFHFNEGNAEPEYQNEEFYNREYNANNIYKAILKKSGREAKLESSDDYTQFINNEVNKVLGEPNDGYSIKLLNGSGMSKQTKWMNCSYDAAIKAVEAIGYTKESLSETVTEGEYKDLCSDLHGYYEGNIQSLSKELKPLLKNIDNDKEPLINFVIKLTDFSREEAIEYLNKFLKNRLTEAAMSDQEVFKVVLEWYKDNIESGKMTLNQCYELLSDKAKVSLNKMVDQSKIKESIMNNTINQLLRESEELNKKN